jgi:hypothetical protein
MRDEEKIPPRAKLILCLAVSLALAVWLCGCRHDEGSPSCRAPNTITPGGTLVRETRAMAADPALEAVLFAEIDAAGVPPRYLVVLYDTEMIPYDGPKYDHVHGYEDEACREIHAGRFADPPYLRVLAHEVEHARCGCYCTSEHASEKRCQ